MPTDGKQRLSCSYSDPDCYSQFHVIAEVIMSDIRTFEDHEPQIADTAYLDKTCTVIGDVKIFADSSVWPGTVIRGDVHAIRIGERSNIQDLSMLHNSHDSEYLPGGSPLIIGNDVTIGHRVILHGCTIGNRVLVGMGAIVMDQAVIEDDVILGAGALVPPGKRLKSGHLYTGSPAKPSRELTEKEFGYLKYSAAHYVRLKNRHMA
jgi:carbonic anhydrase/acetyltransferase-like protein (isoleucine patch superfamily)